MSVQAPPSGHPALKGEPGRPAVAATPPRAARERFDRGHGPDKPNTLPPLRRHGAMEQADKGCLRADIKATQPSQANCNDGYQPQRPLGPTASSQKQKQQPKISLLPSPNPNIDALTITTSTRSISFTSICHFIINDATARCSDKMRTLFIYSICTWSEPKTTG